MTDNAETPEAAPRRFNLFAIVPLIVFALLAALFLYFLLKGDDPSKLPSALIGKPAPQFQLPGIPGLVVNGTPVPGLATSDLGNGKVSVVNVWASWCVPCRQEATALATLPGRLGVSLYGIDQKDAPADATRFLTSLGNPFGKIGSDANGRVSIDWGVYGVPETYVVDGAGKIVYKFVGPLTDEAIETELRPAVERARAGE